MRAGFTLSIIFHALVVLATLSSLPHLSRTTPAGGSAIAVDLVMESSRQIDARTRTVIEPGNPIAEEVEEAAGAPEQFDVAEPEAVAQAAPDPVEPTETIEVTDLPQTILPQQVTTAEPEPLEDAVVIAALPPRLGDVVRTQAPEPEDLTPAPPEQLDAAEPEVTRPEVQEPETVVAQEVQPDVPQVKDVPPSTPVPREKPIELAARIAKEEEAKVATKSAKREDKPPKKKFNVADIGRAIQGGNSGSGRGTPLSRGETGHLEATISKCWKEDKSMPSRIRNKLAVQVRVNFLESGKLKGKPTVMTARPRGNKYTNAAVRSILTGLSRCDLSRLLPKDKFDAWNTMVVTFGKGGARL